MKNKMCDRCKRPGRKCICAKARVGDGVIEMRSRVAAGQMGDKRKEKSRNACRGRVERD